MGKWRRCVVLTIAIATGAALAPVSVHADVPESRTSGEVLGVVPATNGLHPTGAWGIFDDIARWWRQFSRRTAVVVVDVTAVRTKIDDILERGGERWPSQRTKACKLLVGAVFAPIRSNFPLGGSQTRLKQMAKVTISENVDLGDLPYDMQDKLAELVAKQAVNRLLGDPWTDIVHASKVEVCGP